MNGNVSQVLEGRGSLCSSDGKSFSISSSTTRSISDNPNEFPYGLEISFWERLHGRIVPNPLSLESFTDAMMSGELGKFFVVPQIRRIAQECRDSLLERGDWTEMEQVLVNGKKNDMVQGICQAVQQLCAQQHERCHRSGYPSEKEGGEEVVEQGERVNDFPTTGASSCIPLSPHGNGEDHHRRNGLASLVALSRAVPALSSRGSHGRGGGIGRGGFLPVGKKNSEARSSSNSCGIGGRPLISSSTSSTTISNPTPPGRGRIVCETQQSSTSRQSLSNDDYSSTPSVTTQSNRDFSSAATSPRPVNAEFTAGSSSSSWMENSMTCSGLRATMIQKRTIQRLNQRASAFFRVLGLVKVLTIHYGSTPVKFQIPTHFLPGIQSRSLRLYVLPFSQDKNEEGTDFKSELKNPSRTLSMLSSSTYASYGKLFSSTLSSSLSGGGSHVHHSTGAAMEPVVSTVHPHRWPAHKDFAIYVNRTALQGTGWKRTWPERTVEVAKSLLPLDITQYLSFGSPNSSSGRESAPTSPPQQLKIDILQKDFATLAAICVAQTFTVDEVIQRILLRELGALDADMFHRFTSALISSSSSVPQDESQIIQEMEQLEKSVGGEENVYRAQRLLRLLNRGQVYALYRRVIEEEDQGEVVLGADPTVSTYCPLTRGPLQIPVRGVYCSHVQCVDLRNYLLHCQVGSYWNCVVCDAEMREEHICIDSVFWEYLNSLTCNCHESFQETSSLPPRVQLSRQVIDTVHGTPFSPSCSSPFEVGKVSPQSAFLATPTNVESPIEHTTKDIFLPFPQYQWSLLKNDSVNDIVVEDSSDSDDSLERNSVQDNGKISDYHSVLPLPPPPSFTTSLFPNPYLTNSFTNSIITVSSSFIASACSGSSGGPCSDMRSCGEEGEGAEEVTTAGRGTYNYTLPRVVGGKRERANDVYGTLSTSSYSPQVMQEPGTYPTERQEELIKPFSLTHSTLSTEILSSANDSPTMKSADTQAEEGTAANPIEL